MSQLCLKLLGGPEVDHGGHSVSFRTRKALALLIYLSVEKGMHSREKITALMWPESDDIRGRATLRSTLVYLRHALGESSPEHLRIESELIGVNADSGLELDVGKLEVGARDAHNSTVDALASVAGLYRGDFLEGFSLTDAPAFDDWGSVQREYWHRQAVVVFDRLSHLQSGRGEMASALETTARWLQVDALNEGAHRRLIQLHFALGHRGAALKAYERYQNLLATELDAAPAPEIEMLAAKIRAEPAPLPTGADAGRAPSPENIRTPLVGRGEEFFALTEGFARARQGEPHAIMLQGEAGIGKTRLASEFASWALAEGAVVLAGRAFETRGGLPYQPIVEALRHALAREKTFRSLLSETWLAELSPILPEVRELVRGLPSPGADPESAQARLFEAVARLGTAWASGGPLVLWLDDAQWVDAASLDLLRYVARHCNETHTPALLLLNIRSEALASAPAWSEWLEGLERELPVRRIRLEPLTPDATRDLVGQLGAARGNPDEAASLGGWLYRETRGQPFYIIETLKSLVERGLIQSSESGGYDLTAAARQVSELSHLIPAGVREVIRGRLNRLTPAAFDLLCAGAVLGEDFDFEALCGVAGLEAKEALQALDRLLAVSMLRESFRQTGTTTDPVYDFVHDQIRDVVYTEAGEARRRWFHRQALGYLEVHAAAAATRAHHALAAGLLEPAFRYGVDAGEQALGLFAVRDAVAQFERARGLLPMVHPTPEQLTRLYLQFGRAEELVNDWAGARELYQELLALARQWSDMAVQARALNRLASVATQGAMDFDRARELLNDAARAGEASGLAEVRAETEWNLAQVNFFLLHREESLAHGERALALARDLSDRELEARSLNVLGYANWSMGRVRETLARAEEARRTYAQLKNRSMETDCLCQIACAQTCLGQPRAGAEAAGEAFATSAAIENPWGQVNSGVHWSIALIEIGESAQARETARRALKTALHKGVTSLLSFVYSVAGNAERSVGGYASARALHLEGLAIDSTFEQQAFVSGISTEVCADCVLVGDWRAAYLFALRAVAAREHMYPLYAEFSFWYETLALVRGGNSALAEQELERFAARIDGNPRYRIPHLRGHAVLSESRGELSRALDYVRQALALAEDIGLPGEVGELRVLASQLEAGQNWPAG